MQYKNKIKKSIRLYPETLQMLEAYRGQTGEDFTGALESLLIKGLDNNLTAKSLHKKLKLEVDSLKRNNQQLMQLLIKIVKILGEIKAISKVHILKVGVIDNEELESYEKQGIKSALNSIKGGNSYE